MRRATFGGRPGSERTRGWHTTQARAHVDDFERASGTLAQHEWAAQQSGAQMVHLAGVGHWWPEETPAPAAEALTHFWAELPDAAGAPATDSGSDLSTPTV